MDADVAPGLYKKANARFAPQAIDRRRRGAENNNAVSSEECALVSSGGFIQPFLVAGLQRYDGEAPIRREAERGAAFRFRC